MKKSDSPKWTADILTYLLAFQNEYDLDAVIREAKPKYLGHQAGAASRSIKWGFTFGSWLFIWLNSAKWNKRGNKRNEYVMGRFGDKGPYSPSNVEIITGAQNHADYLDNRNFEETQTKRRVSISDSWMEYAMSISTKDRKSSSEGIRVALEYHKANHPNIKQSKKVVA